MKRRAVHPPRIEPTGVVEGAVDRHLARLEAESASGGVSRRRAQGSHYTPPELVEWMLNASLLALDAEAFRTAAPTVLDPACGSGNFLVSAAERLQARGVAAVTLLERHIFGIDRDAQAVEICRGRLVERLARGASRLARNRIEKAVRQHVVVADTLERGPVAALQTHGDSPSSFDLVIGNPPFLSRLESATALGPARVEAIRARHPGALARYADAACAFALDARSALAPGGVLAFVMPQSFLSAAEAGPTRARLLDEARLAALWTCPERLFRDAEVTVCAMCLVAGNPGARGPIARAFGKGFDSLAPWCAPPPSREASWAPVLADAAGVPDASACIRHDETLAAVATATADFRDQYYGLDGAIVEHARPSRRIRPMLVTTRHIDLARCAWGEEPVRVLGARWTHPCVEAARLDADAKMSRWMRARLVPKVVVATQTRILEAAVDARGEWLPLVPLISVMPRVEPEDGDDGACALWRMAAAIASPVAVALAARNLLGSAMSPGALRLSAKQVLALPLPIVRSAWESSARELRCAHDARSEPERAAALVRFARQSCAAHGLHDGAAEPILCFWLSRAGLEDAADAGRRHGAATA